MFVTSAIGPPPRDDSTVVNSRDRCAGAPRKIDCRETPARKQKAVSAYLARIIYSSYYRLGRAWEVNLRKAASRQFKAVQGITDCIHITVRLIEAHHLPGGIYSVAPGVQLNAVGAWKYDIRKLGAREAMRLAIQGADIASHYDARVTNTRYERSATISIGRVNERDLTLSSPKPLTR